MSMFSDALIIARREVHDAVRDWRIVGPMIILAVVFPYVMMFSTKLLTDVFKNSPVPTAVLAPFGLLIVGFFPMSISLVIALEAFAGEKERGSLEPLFASPLSDASLYVGKLLGSVLLPVASCYVGMLVYIVSLWLTSGESVPPGLLLTALLLAAAQGIGMVAAATVISAHTTSIRAANLLASFIVLPVAFLVQVEAIIIFWGEASALWYVLAAVLVIDVLLLRMGIATFSRSAILEREMDDLNLGKLAGSFRAHWTGGSRMSLRRIYTRDLPGLLTKNSLPLLVTLIAAVVGLGAGAYFAVTHPLPPQLVAPARVPAGLGGTPLNAGIEFLPGLEIRGIFTHNLRSLFISAILAVFSFGTAPLLVLATPSAIIGFFTMQIAQGGADWLMFLAAFILPHGIVEIPAAVLATTFSLRLGASLTAGSDGEPTGDRFMQALADWVKVFVFMVVPLLLLAAFLESAVTPRIVALFYGG